MDQTSLPRETSGCLIGTAVLRTRMAGGVGALADLTVSQGDPIRIFN